MALVASVCPCCALARAPRASCACHAPRALLRTPRAPHAAALAAHLPQQPAPTAPHPHPHPPPTPTLSVVGSQSPSIEALALVLGAASVTVLEYQPLSYEHPRVRTLRPAEVAAAPGAHAGAYGVVIAAAALDHDGLGRYGDPLAPDGDLLSMDDLRRFYAAPGGLALVSLPCGADSLSWNLGRVYGALRLPLMLEGWEEGREPGGAPGGTRALASRVGWSAGLLAARAPASQRTEVVFTLWAPRQGARAQAPGELWQEGGPGGGGQRGGRAASEAQNGGGGGAQAPTHPRGAAAAAAAVGGAGRGTGSPPPQPPADAAQGLHSPPSTPVATPPRSGRLAPAPRAVEERDEL